MRERRWSGLWIGMVLPMGALFGQVIAPALQTGDWNSFPNSPGNPSVMSRYPDSWGRTTGGRALPTEIGRPELSDAEDPWANQRALLNQATGGNRWTISADELRHPPSRKGRQLLENALKSSKANDHEKSIVLLIEALKDPGAAIYAHSLLGTEYLRTNRLSDALPELQEAARALPRSAGSRSNLGFALCLSGQLEAGRAEIEEALRLNQDLPQAHFLLGVLQLHQSQGQEGESHLRRAAASNLGSARLMLAILYFREGNDAAAEQHLLDYQTLHSSAGLQQLRAWAQHVDGNYAEIGLHLGSQD